MLSFIVTVLALSSLSRRTRYWGFPFMGGWRYRCHPRGRHHRHPTGWRHGMGGRFRGGPHGHF